MRAYITSMVLVATCLIQVLLLAQPASAQADEPPGGNLAGLSGAVLVVLPDTYNVEEEVATNLYGQLVLAITDHPGFELVDTPPQTFEELAYAVGCVDAGSPDCLEMVGDFLYADYIVKSELESTGGAFVLDIALVDCFTGEVHNRVNRPIEGNQDLFVSYLPVLAKAAVYGPVGQLVVDYTPRNATVELDGNPISGNGHIELANLDLGPHILRVSHPDYFVYRDTLLVDVEPGEVEVELVLQAERVAVSGGRLWTWVTLGTGVALAGTGVAFGLLTSSTQDTYDREASRISIDPVRLDDLQNTGEQQALLTNIFVGAGAALVATSVVLFFVEGSGSDDAGATSMTIGPRVNDNGYSLQLGINY